MAASDGPRECRLRAGMTTDAPLRLLLCACDTRFASIDGRVELDAALDVLAVLARFWRALYEASW